MRLLDRIHIQLTKCISGCLTGFSLLWPVVQYACTVSYREGIKLGPDSRLRKIIPHWKFLRNLIANYLQQQEFTISTYFPNANQNLKTIFSVVPVEIYLSGGIQKVFLKTFLKFFSFHSWWQIEKTRQKYLHFFFSHYVLNACADLPFWPRRYTQRQFKT